MEKTKTMTLFKRRIIGRICRLTLAAVLALNTAALGATELEVEQLPEVSGGSMPCHMPQDHGEDHDGHSPACDSLCAQCIGFILGSAEDGRDGFASAGLDSDVAKDPLPRFATPPYKPPRA